MSVAYLATSMSVYMQSLICLCTLAKRQQRSQCWQTRLLLASEKSCVHLSACEQSRTSGAELSVEQLT